ncbi:20694_t:CDS:1, partial [Racocetra persica]
EKLHLLKENINNLGTQVCKIKNFYKAICGTHQAIEHKGQEKLEKR